MIPSRPILPHRPPGRALESIAPPATEQAVIPASVRSTMRSCSAITNGRRLSGRCKGAAVAANDTWAVGTITDPTTGFGRTLTEHLDGTSWSVITGPNATTGQNALNGGAALRTGDVVAVGFAIDANGHTNNLILHS